MRKRAIIIGTPATCALIERQLDLLDDRPVTIGWVIRPQDDANRMPARIPLLGTTDELDTIAHTHAMDLALISLPAIMTDLVARLRTTLRRHGVDERFMPTLHDQLDGVGPRTHYDIDPSLLLQRAPRTIDRDSIRDLIRGRRVMITGAGGSIGSELSRLVCQFEPSQLALVERSENALFEVDRQVARRCPNLLRHTVLHDIVDAEATLDQFRSLRPEIVFHAAAHKHVPMMEHHPSAAVDNNLMGTKSVVDAAHATKVDRFVMISTDKAVHPTSVMGATKRLSELYVQWRHHDSATSFAMVRFGNVLGSSGSVLEVWAQQVAAGGPLTVTDQRMTRYFMSIPEAAALVTQSAALVDPKSPSGEVFLLDMGQPISITDMAHAFIQMHGLTPTDDVDAAQDAHQQTVGLVFTGIRPGEKLHEELAFDAESMRPTRHPDINIWLVPGVDDAFIGQMIDALRPGRRPEGSALSSLVHQFVRQADGMPPAVHESYPTASQTVEVVTSRIQRAVS
ncbi:MAG: polysaccharide biosynthesis protein [Planctomycetota bacterium]